MFEKRPTDIQKIGNALMVGLFIGVPLLMFAQYAQEWHESRTIYKHRVNIQKTTDASVQEIAEGKRR